MNSSTPELTVYSACSTQVGHIHSKHCTAELYITLRVVNLTKERKVFSSQMMTANVYKFNIHIFSQGNPGLYSVHLDFSAVCPSNFSIFLEIFLLAKVPRTYSHCVVFAIVSSFQTRLILVCYFYHVKDITNTT